MVDPKALAAKLDRAYWPKVIHGIDVQLSHQEIAAARDWIRVAVLSPSHQAPVETTKERQ